jgi:hypothetical protein
MKVDLDKPARIVGDELLGGMPGRRRRVNPGLAMMV